MNTWRRMAGLMTGNLSHAVERVPTKRKEGRALVVLLAAMAMLAVALAAWATNVRVFAVGNRTFGTTNGYAIVPAVGGKVAMITMLSVTCDQAPGRVVIYSNSPPSIVLVDHPLTSSNIMVDANSYNTNGMAAGDVLLAHVGNTPNDRYDRLRVVSVSTTNILIAVTSSIPLTAGSRLYRVSTNVVITGVTNGPTSLYNTRLISASELGQPLLIDIIGTSSLGQILGVAGEYLDAAAP